jgi:hypothetical protein
LGCRGSIAVVEILAFSQDPPVEESNFLRTWTAQPLYLSLHISPDWNGWSPVRKKNCCIKKKLLGYMLGVEGIRGETEGRKEGWSDLRSTSTHP